MAITVGSQLSQYELTALIGEGGMGRVFQARDTRLGRSVAIKVLPDAFATDTERIARFEREAKMLASLNHPNIASLIGMEQAEGNHFLVMELIEGDTIADRRRASRSRTTPFARVSGHCTRDRLTDWRPRLCFWIPTSSGSHLPTGLRMER